MFIFIRQHGEDKAEESGLTLATDQLMNAGLRNPHKFERCRRLPSHPSFPPFLAFFPSFGILAVVAQLVVNILSWDRYSTLSCLGHGIYLIIAEFTEMRIHLLLVRDRSRAR